MKSILFLGVTGPFSFGQFVVAEISKSLHLFARVAVYHDTSRPTDAGKEGRLKQLRESGIEIITSHGYESSKVFAGFDCVLSFLGNHALHLQPAIIDLAIEAGVRHFYPSEYGADIMMGQNPSQRYYRDKVKCREHLQKRGLELPELGWTFFMLGRLTEWAVISHFGVDNRNFRAHIYGTSAGRQSLLATADAARYIVATLTAPLDDESLGGHRREIRISCSSPTYEEIFEILGSVRGKTYNVTYLSIEGATEEEEQAKASGDVDAELAANHKLIQGRQGTLLPEPLDNSKFPEVPQPMSVEEALRAAFGSKMFRMAYGLGDAD